MRKVLLLTFLVMFFTSVANAATDDIGQGMIDKAWRGGVNLLTGIVEVPAQAYKGFHKGFEPIKNEPLSKTVGTVLGLFRGISHAAGRMSWGAMELLGFWAVNPEDNDGVGLPLDAEYAWEEGEQYSIFEPSLKEGIKPIGRKLVRGIGNGFGGILELPGQIMQGADEGSVVKGIGEGVWFWLSREIYGMGELVTCIVPNPETNPGFAFDEDWPWEAFSGEIKKE